MSTQMIQINPNPTPTQSQPAVFAPKVATVYAYDTITWHNADTQAHQPAPSAANPKGWFDYQIPAGATSDTLAPGPNTSNATQPYTLNYVCAIHPGETGQITVNPPQQ